MKRVLVKGFVAIGICLSLGAGAPVSAVTAEVVTRTGPPIGTTLYTANWSSGLNGWAGDSSWKTLRGALLSDGTGWDANIFAPYDSKAVTDYAVEARIRVIKPDRMGIVFRHSASEAGYVAVVEDSGYTWLGAGDDAYYAEKIADGQRFDPGTGWHAYRIEADGNEVRFLIDGAQFATAVDNRYLSGGVAGLTAHHSQIEVSGFAVLRLR
jgi:hypothetical protein